MSNSVGCGLVKGSRRGGQSGGRALREWRRRRRRRSGSGCLRGWGRRRRRWDHAIGHLYQLLPLLHHVLEALGEPLVHLCHLAPDEVNELAQPSDLEGGRGAHNKG